MQTIFSNAVLQRTGQRWHNFQDRARNVPPLNNGVIVVRSKGVRGNTKVS